jgi:hypothetical protein
MISGDAGDSSESSPSTSMATLSVAPLPAGADVVRSGAISSDGARSGATSSDGALDVRSGAMIVLAWAYLGRKGFVLKRLD